MLNSGDIERHLAQAIEDATPDVLSSILYQAEVIKHQTATASLPWDGNVCPLPQARKGAGKLKGWVGAAASLLLVAFGGYLGYGGFAVDTVIGLDVNPSIQLQLNRFDRVRSAVPLNGDAEEVLAGVDLKNAKLDVAVGALLDSMLRDGYLTEEQNAILISVENRSATRGSRIQQQLTGEINHLLQEHEVEGAVISQTVPEDSRLQQLAAEYDISPGKAALVEMLVDADDTLSFEEVAELPISDIHLLVSNRQEELEGVMYTGNANSDQYLESEEAAAAALEYAGVSEAELTALRLEMGYEEGHMIYRIVFDTAEACYSIQLDAGTGEVLAFEKGPRLASGEESARIGEAEAKAAALRHAGLGEHEVDSLSLALDEEGGVYRVTFHSGPVGYDYSVDAGSGNILSHSREPLDEPESSSAQEESLPEDISEGSSPTPGEESQDGGAPTDVIGDAQAKSIALEYAGVPEEDAHIVLVAVDSTEDEIVSYAIEFIAGTLRYLCVVDAHTGDVLAFDSSAVDPGPQEEDEEGGFSDPEESTIEDA